MNERRKVVKRGLSVLFICSYILCCAGLYDVFLFSPLDTEMLMDLLNNSARPITAEEEEEQFWRRRWWVFCGWRTDNRVPPPSNWNRFDTLVSWMKICIHARKPSSREVPDVACSTPISGSGLNLSATSLSCIFIRFFRSSPFSIDQVA